MRRISLTTCASVTVGFTLASFYVTGRYGHLLQSNVLKLDTNLRSHTASQGDSEVIDQGILGSHHNEAVLLTEMRQIDDVKTKGGSLRAPTTMISLPVSLKLSTPHDEALLRTDGEREPGAQRITHDLVSP